MTVMAAEARTFTDPKTGREITQLTDNTRRSVHGYYDLPPWSTADWRIAFSRMDAPKVKSGDICVMDEDGGNLKVLTLSRVMSPNDGAMAQWSADGKRIYFKQRSEAGQRQIGWVDADSGEHGAMTGDLRMIRPVGNANAHFTHHTDFSEDDVPGLKAQMGVFAQDLDTGASTCLATLADCLEIHPRRDEIKDWHMFVKHTKWSPDGSRMSFVFTNEIHFDRKYGELPRVKDMYVINADGSGLKRVGEFGNHPLWHPNGNEILANSPWEGREGNSLVLTDVDTGETRLAATCIGGFGHPSFSPDGKWIAVDVVDRKTGSARIDLVDVDADTVETLVETTVTDHTHDGTHIHPCWRQDGRELIYASDASGTAQLMKVKI